MNIWIWWYVCLHNFFYDVDIFFYDNAITTSIEDETKKGSLASIMDFRWILYLDAQWFTNGEL
jgi:hypothetical protein